MPIPSTSAHRPDDVVAFSSLLMLPVFTRTVRYEDGRHCFTCPGPLRGSEALSTPFAMSQLQCARRTISLALQQHLPKMCDSSRPVSHPLRDTASSKDEAASKLSATPCSSAIATLLQWTGQECVYRMAVSAHRQHTSHDAISEAQRPPRRGLCRHSFMTCLTRTMTYSL